MQGLATAMLTLLGILAAAFLIDAIFGEYPARLHPVVWIGKLITNLLRFAPAAGAWRRWAFGVVLTLGVTLITVVASVGLLVLSATLPIVQALLAVVLLKASLALRELIASARRVAEAVRKDEIDEARIQLRSLCSRDPASLDGEELLGAAVQSLAENVSDSFIAPVFYYGLFHVPGALGYRAINTLDSMIGYRGEFEELGKPAARLDDVVNWIPARLSGILLLLAGWLTGKNVAGGERTRKRDAGKTPSPNGGQPMAVMAGLLDVQLVKKDAYTLGDPGQPITVDVVEEACRLVRLASWLMLALAAALIALIQML